RSEMIDLAFNGCPGPGRMVSSTIPHHGDMITTLYIHMSKYNDETKKIKNFYRILEYIELQIGGTQIFKLSLEYIKLYYKLVKGIDLEMLSDKSISIIPINLKELVNIPFIHLPSQHEIRLYCTFHPGRIFGVDTDRHIDDNSNTEDENLLDLLPLEIWINILSYLDDKSWVAMRHVCKFFYFLNTDTEIENKYKKYKIQTHMINFDASLKIMFHALADKTKENTQSPTFLNQFRSIDHQRYQCTCNVNDIFLQRKPIEFIFIDIENKFYKDVIQEIKLHNNTAAPQGFIKEIKMPKDDVYFLEKDTKLHEKMHDPLNGRYVIYPDNEYLEKIELLFKKEINTIINVYISYKEWLLYGHDMIGCIPIESDCEFN
ncbi:MAG: F-box protein, partial [Nitrososphaeraceae archaeon]|nr:F-box protein [Nitrososphaeraceae archaeon]